MGDTSRLDTRRLLERRVALSVFVFLVCAAEVAGFPQDRPDTRSASGNSSNQQQREVLKTPQSSQDQPKLVPDVESTEDWNRRLRERSVSVEPTPSSNAAEYTIGPEDVLAITVFEAQELNREVRVAANGEISLPLLGAVRASGLTPRQLETTLEELLHQKYMKDPHVGVFVRDMESHPVSVMGAVHKPGVYQIRGSKSLLEILSLAEGLADDAGEDVIILRGGSANHTSESVPEKSSEAAKPPATMQEFGGADETYAVINKAETIPQKTLQVNLKDLLDSTDSSHNPAVYPGDIVKVSRAGIVYVVGAVRRPGGFAMKTNGKISVLQAIALSEGLTPTAAKGGARIIRTSEQNGARTETALDLGKILSGKSADPMLEPKDIVFVPDSAAKTTLFRGVEVGAQTLTGLLIFHW
jgi:polysaccharide biosynthesis/export protein